MTEIVTSIVLIVLIAVFGFLGILVGFMLLPIAVEGYLEAKKMCKKFKKER